MVRPPCFDSNGMKKGAWSEDEDNKLRAFILTYGHWNWRLLPKYAGLKRCGKSCRLRWVNHLKPGVKRGSFSKEEEDLIIRLHTQLGNKWSAIAMELPGRTDNDIKNFWNSRVARRPKSKPSPAASSMEMPPTLTHHLVKAAFDADSTQPQMDSWGDQLIAASDTNFPPLLEEEFCYPELHHTDLWCSNMNSEQDWIAYNEEVFDPLFCLWNL